MGGLPSTLSLLSVRPKVPHELFATYWRDVHGPLCSRIPGLGWYVQNHFHREQDAHLWPEIDGLEPFENYVLDGGVEIGLQTSADQKAFNEACSILFADEQNMFAATAAYALPEGSTTLVDRIPDPNPNWDDGLDRMHVHFGARTSDADAFSKFMRNLTRALASDQTVLKVRLHLTDRYDNSKPAPPASNVEHTVSIERRLIAVLELAFATPSVTPTAFAVSGNYTYVRDKNLTTAGLRGSRPAQLIDALGATNQISEDVRKLMFTGQV